jgi:dienelactone hydrolase
MTQNRPEFAVPLPQSLNDWQAQRNHYRQTLLSLLGDLPPMFTPQLKITATEKRDSYTLQTFSFDNGADANVPGWLMIPDGLTAPAPAVLYLHAHGGKYARGKNELFDDPLMGFSPVPALMAAGYIVMAIDCYMFGERSTVVPSGTMEPSREVELTWFKKFLWEGRTLWGMIVRDDTLALNALLAHPQVDPARVALTGMSLGGSRTTWLAALDERPAAVIPVAQMTRYADFAARGEYHHHGVYYYVPGALKSGLDMEILAALAAPRLQTILIGDSDPLSPIEGVRKIDAFTRHIYDLYGANERYQTIYHEGIAHAYTPQMFDDVLAALDQMKRRE